MFMHRLFALLLVGAVCVLTACASAPTPVAAPTRSALAATTIPSTHIPTPILTVASTATSLPAATQSPISAMTVDDARMARLRLANFVSGSAATDMYVDGHIAVLGTRQRQLTRVPVGFITGFLYVEPGTHSVAVVPTGKELSSAMIALNVTLEVGHCYTVGAMGQKEDTSFTPLVIDETKAVAKARTFRDQGIMILVNNIAGANTIDFLEDGLGPSKVPYGGFVAAPIKTGHVDRLLNVVNGDSTIEDIRNFDEIPGINLLHTLNGRFPGLWIPPFFQT